MSTGASAGQPDRPKSHDRTRFSAAAASMLFATSSPTNGSSIRTFNDVKWLSRWLMSPITRMRPAACSIARRALKQNDLALLLPNLGQAQHPAGDVLYEPGDSVDYAYFRCRQSLVSYRVALPDGRGVETALIGREAAVGGIVSQGRLPSYARAVVQLEGQFLKVSSAQLEHLKKTSSSCRAMNTRPRRVFNTPSSRIHRARPQMDPAARDASADDQAGRLIVPGVNGTGHRRRYGQARRSIHLAARCSME